MRFYNMELELLLIATLIIYVTKLFMLTNHTLSSFFQFLSYEKYTYFDICLNYQVTVILHTPNVSESRESIPNVYYSNDIIPEKKTSLSMLL